MTGLEQWAALAAEAGVTLEELGRWTESDWRDYLARLEGQQVATLAELDRAQAVLAEASRCGCPVLVELDDDGEPLVGTGRVDHRCAGPR